MKRKDIREINWMIDTLYKENVMDERLAPHKADIFVADMKTQEVLEIQKNIHYDPERLEKFTSFDHGNLELRVGISLNWDKLDGSVENEFHIFEKGREVALPERFDQFSNEDKRKVFPVWVVKPDLDERDYEKMEKFLETGNEKELERIFIKVDDPRMLETEENFIESMEGSSGGWSQRSDLIEIVVGDQETQDIKIFQVDRSKMENYNAEKFEKFTEDNPWAFVATKIENEYGKTEYHFFENGREFEVERFENDIEMLKDNFAHLVAAKGEITDFDLETYEKAIETKDASMVEKLYDRFVDTKERFLEASPFVKSVEVNQEKMSDIRESLEKVFTEKGETIIWKDAPEDANIKLEKIFLKDGDTGATEILETNSRLKPNDFDYLVNPNDSEQSIAKDLGINVKIEIHSPSKMLYNESPIERHGFKEDEINYVVETRLEHYVRYYKDDPNIGDIKFNEDYIRDNLELFANERIDAYESQIDDYKGMLEEAINEIVSDSDYKIFKNIENEDAKVAFFLDSDTLSKKVETTETISKMLAEAEDKLEFWKTDVLGEPHERTPFEDKDDLFDVYEKSEDLKTEKESTFKMYLDKFVKGVGKYLETRIEDYKNIADKQEKNEANTESIYEKILIGETNEQIEQSEDTFGYDLTDVYSTDDKSIANLVSDYNDEFKDFEKAMDKIEEKPNAFLNPMHLEPNVFFENEFEFYEDNLNPADFLGEENKWDLIEKVMEIKDITFEKIGKFLENVPDYVKNAFEFSKVAWEKTTEFLGGVGEKAKDMLSTIGGIAGKGFEKLHDAFIETKGTLSNAFEKIEGTIAKGAELIGKALDEPISDIKEMINDIKDNLYDPMERYEDQDYLEMVMDDYSQEFEDYIERDDRFESLSGDFYPDTAYEV